MKHLLARALEAAGPFVTHGKSPMGLPLPPLSYRMGGEHFRRDSAYVAGGVRDTKRLIELAALGRESRLLDWGCGAGRLAVGVGEIFGRVADYHGVDVQAHLINWAARHLGKQPGFRFTHVDLHNARYNPSGKQVRTIPASTGEVDVFYAYSVFSHMLSVETYDYLKEVARLLSPTGIGVFTAFVEDDVPDELENPVGYGPMHWQGALHCVRYDRTFFDSLIQDAGLAVTGFIHGQETDGQSLYVVQGR